MILYMVLIPFCGYNGSAKISYYQFHTYVQSTTETMLTERTRSKQGRPYTNKNYLDATQRKIRLILILTSQNE